MKSFWPLLEQLKSGSFVDLSHSFSPTTPLCEVLPKTTFNKVLSYKEHGVLSHAYNFVGQCGTHIDPPCHLVDGLRALDQITLEELILPLVVIDVHKEVQDNPDYMLQISDVVNWEAQYGELPSQAFVAMRTDWSERWPDDAAVQNRDSAGVTHWPGWSMEVLRFLAEERSVVAIGHETIGTDGGIDTARGNYERQHYWQAQDRYQIELMANLHKLPPFGSILICAFPVAEKGSGFPARVIAVIP